MGWSSVHSEVGIVRSGRSGETSVRLALELALVIHDKVGMDKFKRI